MLRDALLIILILTIVGPIGTILGYWPARYGWGGGGLGLALLIILIVLLLRADFGGGPH